MADQPLDVFELPVHPAAAKFPMLPDHELQALAADIKTNGLHHPLLVDEVDSLFMLMDGRNRCEACRIAGVTPAIENITGEDLIMRLWSENGRRRDLSKGAKAMVAACIFSRPEQGKRKTSLKIKEVGLNAGSLSQARTVIRYAAELVDDVKAGQRSLVKAYKIASNRKKANEFRQDTIPQSQSVAPDLADPVADEDPEVQRQDLTDDKRDVRRKICETKAKRKPQPPAQPAAARATAHEASTDIRQHSARVVDSRHRGGTRAGESEAAGRLVFAVAANSAGVESLGWSDDNARRFVEVRDRVKNQDTEELVPIDLSVLYIAASLAGDEPVKTTKAPEPGTPAAE